MIARPRLADVVQERAHEEEVRATHLTQVIRGLGRRLHEMPVHAIQVHGTPLRCRPHSSPLRKEPHDESLLVERFPHRHKPRPRTQQRDECVAGFRGPRRGKWRRLASKPRHRPGREREPCLGGRRSDTQHEHGVAVRTRIGSERHFAVVHDDTLTQGHPLRSRSTQPPADRTIEATTFEPRDAVPHGVGGVGDGTRSLAEVPQQGIASAQAESMSDVVLVLGAQDVGGTPILR